jgi:hypothetical protein
MGAMSVTEPTRRVTFRIAADIVERMDEAIARGQVASRQEFIAQALAGYLRRFPEQGAAAQWEQAARDPMFLADCEEVAEDFAGSGATTAGRADE